MSASRVAANEEFLIPNRSEHTARRKKVKAKNNPFPASKSRKKGHRRQRSPYVVTGKIVHNRSMKSLLVQEVIESGRASARFGNHPDLPLTNQVEQLTRSEGRPPSSIPDVAPEQWPAGVERLSATYNPSGIQFPDVGDLGRCDCQHYCARMRCVNAIMGILCGDDNCGDGNDCGNRAVEHDGLELFHGSFGYHLRATTFINSGSVVCSYLGRLTLATSGAGGRQHEYALKLRTRSKQGKLVFIDAEEAGGFGRFANHSCTPNCVFVELRCRDQVAVVLLAITRINAGEEVTVDYDDELWFHCQCGSIKCRTS